MRRSEINNFIYVFDSRFCDCVFKCERTIEGIFFDFSKDIVFLILIVRLCLKNNRCSLCSKREKYFNNRVL